MDTVRTVLGKYPIVGICMGHQVLAQALGGSTYKLKFGHRGANHPVKDLTTGKISYEDLDEELARTYIGGVGLAAKILWERNYNTIRPHQALGYMTPLKFLEQWKGTQRKEVISH